MTDLRIGDRWLDSLGLAFLAATFALVAACSLLRPAYNWDVLPYVALASETPAMSAAERHEVAYRLVEAAAPGSDWALLTADGAYRVQMAADAEAFDNQLGMYRIKPAYIHAARALACRVSVEVLTVRPPEPIPMARTQQPQAGFEV